MAKEKKKVPNLRFKGFTDDWEQRKLGEVAEFYNGDRGPNYPKPSEIVEQGVPFINAGDLINGHIDYHNCKHITSDKFNQLNGAKLKINDIVYCLRGTIGKNGLVNSDANATIASSLVCIRPVKLRPLFLFQLLNSSIEERQRKMVDEGAAQPNISATNLKKFLIPVPNDNEQEKIGEVFSKLNHLITLQQQKLDLLKQLKKGLLQKMFAEKNSKQPVLRFKGFHDDWEQRKLKDVVEKQIKGKAQFEKLAPGEVEYLDTSRLNGGQAILTNGLKDVTLDDILILWDGSKAGTVYHGFEGALGSTLKAYRTSANSKFVYQYLKRHQDNIYNNYRTPNIPHVQKDFLNVFTISVPVSDEQEKIGSFFQQLDNTIVLQHQKIAKYQSIKKSLLQQMFI